MITFWMFGKNMYINFTCFFLLFFSTAIRTLKMTRGAGVVFLLTVAAYIMNLILAWQVCSPGGLTTSLFLKGVFIYLGGRHTERKRGKKQRSFTYWFTPRKMVTTGRAGAWSSIQISKREAGAQAVRPSSATFSGVLAKSSIRSGVERPWIGTQAST